MYTEGPCGFQDIKAAPDVDLRRSNGIPLGCGFQKGSQMNDRSKRMPSEDLRHLLPVPYITLYGGIGEMGVRFVQTLSIQNHHGLAASRKR
jgi:hypothetical protein